MHKIKIIKFYDNIDIPFYYICKTPEYGWTPNVSFQPRMNRHIRPEKGFLP